MFEQNIIPNQPATPQGSWISFEFIPIEEVSQFIPVGGKCLITLNRDFRKIAVHDIENQSSQQDDLSYSHSITAHIALRSTAAHGILNAMAAGGRYIVRLTDWSGTREIFGTPECPLRFTWSDSSSPEELTTLTFAGETLQPSLVQM